MLTQKLNTKLKVETVDRSCILFIWFDMHAQLELMQFSLINNHKSVWQPPIKFNLCNTWLISPLGVASIRGIVIFNILFYFVIYLFFF